MEFFLEFRFFVVGYLSNRMANSVTDHWVLVLERSEHKLNNWLDFIHFFDVLSNLGKGHDCGKFISPVFLSEQNLNCLTDDREHDGFSNWGNKSVNWTHSKPCGFIVIVLLNVVVKSFRRFLPFLWDIAADLNHMEEDHLYQLLKLALVALKQLGETFSDHN